MTDQEFFTYIKRLIYNDLKKYEEDTAPFNFREKLLIHADKIEKRCKDTETFFELLNKLQKSL